MARAGRRVLFVGHEATRTGAPIMLLHLLRWLRASTDLDFDLLLPRDGPLLDDYRRLCTVFIADPRPHPSRAAALRARARRWRRPAEWLSTVGRQLRRRDLGLIYANTVANGPIVDWLAPLGCPVVCHVHEVDSWIRAMSPADLAALPRRASTFITLTDPMDATLQRLGVAPERIVRIPGFVPAVALAAPDLAARRRFRRQHQIPDDVVLVGGCGSVHWQKGTDLLVHIAGLASRSRLRALHFVWVGGQDGEAVRQLRWDVERSSASGCVSWIPALDDPSDYLRSLDILAITSRDDPQPLVALEAGACGVPVVCFRGNALLVDDTCGRVVPYLDLEQFAAAVRALADDGPLRATLGANLAERVRANHDVAVNAPLIAEVIRSHIG
jgi:glycosyltransferase involved in cell wall biosynthesis